MKLFSATSLLFFMISLETQCVIDTIIPGVDLSKIWSYIPFWGKGKELKNASTTPAIPTTTEGTQSGALPWKQKFQNTLISFLPNISENARVRMLVALKVLLSYVPTFGFIIGTVIDEVIEKYVRSKGKDTNLNTDSTDAMIFKLMAQKIDEKNLDEFLQITEDSRLIKDMLAGFMNSLQQISDNFVEKYIEDIKSKSKR